jgi:hypothetical protein
MKKTIGSMFETGVLQLLVLAALIVAMFATSGCATQKKMRDIELKGMYVNGYSEVLALGWGRLTSIPGDKEALAAHYEEDTAWLQPNVKTHKIDIFLVGTNTVASSADIIGSICKAFAEVAPAVSKENAEVAKSVATVTPLGVVKSGGEVRKTVQLAKIATKEIKGSGVSSQESGVSSQESGASSQESGSSDPHCADGSCTTGDCPDGNCSYSEVE